MPKSQLSTDTQDDGLPTPRRYWAVLAIAVAIAMAVLDGAIANIALPTLTSQLRSSPSAAVWIVNAYQLTIVVSLLPLAALGERIGYRRVFTAGLAIFTIGSFSCALTRDLSALVAARALQGLGAAGVMSVNGALIRFTFPRSKLGMGIGLNAMVVASAAAIGPSLASAILAVASWPWLFFINVPFGVVNFFLAAKALPESPRSDRRYDALSAALSIFAVGAFFLGVSRLSNSSGGQRPGITETILAAAAFAVLIAREKSSSRPMIPTDLMRLPVFSLSFAASILSFVSYTSAFIALPFFYETGLHKSVVETGLLMTPWPLAIGLTAPMAGKLSDRFNPGVLGGLGLTTLALGLVLLAFAPAHPSDWDIVWRSAVGALGFGTFQTPNNSIMLGAAPRERSGAASGMLAVARLLGMTIGATLIAFFLRMYPSTFEHVTLLTGACLAVAAAGLSLSRALPKHEVHEVERTVVVGAVRGGKHHR